MWLLFGRWRIWSYLAPASAFFNTPIFQREWQYWKLWNVGPLGDHRRVKWKQILRAFCSKWNLLLCLAISGVSLFCHKYGVMYLKKVPTCSVISACARLSQAWFDCFPGAWTSPFYPSSIFCVFWKWLYHRWSFLLSASSTFDDRVILIMNALNRYIA